MPISKMLFPKGIRKQQKKRSNELYIGKLIKAVHFLAANNLPVKELYPKLVSFRAVDIEEPVVKQYLDTCKKMQLINLRIVVTPLSFISENLLQRTRN